MKKYLFEIEDKVRDYECDLQGVVNNANYQHYMEHARHEFLGSLGENFSAMHDRGQDAFVSRVEIQYKNPLHSGERYLSCLNLKREGVKLVFLQDIYLLPERKLAARGIIDTVLVQDGKLTRGEFFDELLKKAEENNKQAHDR